MMTIRILFIRSLIRVNWEEAVARSSSNSTAGTADHLLSEEETEKRRQWNIYIYSFSILLVLVLTLSRSFSFFKMCLRASITLHDKLFRGIIRSTMVFFNNNPSGRILNRFSMDIGCIDSLLPMAMMDCLLVSFTAFASLFPTPRLS